MDSDGLYLPLEAGSGGPHGVLAQQDVHHVQHASLHPVQAVCCRHQVPGEDLTMLVKLVFLMVTTTAHLSVTRLAPQKTLVPDTARLAWGIFHYH